MNVEKSIFKAYDIRGTYPDQLNAEVAYAITRAYATLLIKENPGKELSIAVGGDMRLSTPELKDQVIKGLLDSGLNAIDVGLVSTPTFYYAVAKYGRDGGLQVSASHNPAEWNGIKLTRKSAVPVSKDTGIMEMLAMVETDDFAPIADKKGSLEKQEGVLKELVDELTSLVDIGKIKKMKVVLDGANAMGSPDYLALFEKVGLEVIEMNTELDGTFPAHEADPFKEENTKDLSLKVVETSASLGVAPDGDADRIFFTDEKGKVIHPAILRGLAAQIELKEHPGATVGYDIRPGRITRDMIEEFGGKALVTQVGHSLIKEAMIKAGAIFGGESSGHFFYKMPYGTFEVPLLLTLKLLIYISEAGKPVSEIISKFERYSHSGEINTKVGSREEVVQILEEIKNKYADGKQNFLDGISVEYDNFWFNVRASNTEPVIRLTVEALDDNIMQEKRDELLVIIRKNN